MILYCRPADAAPPVFEQIFRNARFAQGGNAHFQGKLRGNPKPQVSWTRKGAPLFGEWLTNVLNNFLLKHNTFFML